MTSEFWSACRARFGEEAEAELRAAFDAALEAEKLEALAEFAAGAGHEINNPLTVISGRAQLLLRDETDPERRRTLALIRAQAVRVHEMIADMRLFARPPEPERKPLDLVALIDQIAEELSAEYARQEIAVERAGESGEVPVEADPVQLSVAVRALCRNSAEAIGHAGRIELEVRAERDEVLVLVRDTGPGITPDERRHIFDPFFSARQAGRGLGLGLSKAWRIVTNHGGRIEVDSKPGHGATFLIRFPSVFPR
ncbi:MAG: ATP-binding protein [Thermoguttaceae bacterium]|jgi:signal transduction histidine kinase|nr:ATP-binding protein [Thermoguttaceae bacterium]